jgi:hypothetical protein
MATSSSPWLRIALVVAASVETTACVPKARWVPNDRGGYTLSTTCDRIEDAMIRFRRAGKELCRADQYTIAPPQVVSSEFNINRFGGPGTEMTVQADLVCR